MCIRDRFNEFAVQRFGSMEGFIEHVDRLIKDNRSMNLTAARVFLNHLRWEDHCALKSFLHSMDSDSFDRLCAEVLFLNISYTAELFEILQEAKEQLPVCILTYS